MELTAIQILLLTIAGSAALVYAAVRLYTMCCALHIGHTCRRDSLDEEDARQLYGRFIYQEVQHEIRASSTSAVLAFLLVWVLLVALWFFGAESSQAEALRILLIAFIVACCVFALGRITKSVSLLALPKGVTEQDGDAPSDQPLKKTLGAGTVPLLLILILYAAALWLLSL